MNHPSEKGISLITGGLQWRVRRAMQCVAPKACGKDAGRGEDVDRGEDVAFGKDAASGNDVASDKEMARVTLGPVRLCRQPYSTTALLAPSRSTRARCNASAGVT